jgi:phosphoribosylpyrophosphate synthetase
MTGWKPFPDGTRVRHLSDHYEGWIDGLTRLKGSETNPDGKTQYRIRIHTQRERNLSSHDKLEDCKDTERIFRSTEDLVQKLIEKKSDHEINDQHWISLLPLPYTVWALNNYDPTSQGDPVKLVKDAAIFGDTTKNAVDQFFWRLDKILNPGIPIAIVPSCEKNEYNPALLQLAERLAENERTDATSLVARHQSIESSRMKRQNGRPGNTIDEHLASIQIAEPSRVTGKIVLLLDDVVTKGAAFMACRKLLLDAGVAEVICLALGRTQRGNQRQDKDHKKTRPDFKINRPK